MRIVRKPKCLSKPFKPYDPMRPLWCLHLPKCAGTTMRDVFKKWFPTQDFNIGMCTHFWDKEHVNVEDIKNKHGISNPQLITQLREPFDLVQSLYWYQRWTDPNNAVFYDAKHKLISLRQFLYVHEHSIQQYLPHGNTAKEILNQCTIVGIYEELDAFMSFVGDWIGQPLKEPLPELNKTPTYEEQDLREEYKSARPDLYVLYDEAVRRWNLLKRKW